MKLEYLGDSYDLVKRTLLAVGGGPFVAASFMPDRPDGAALEQYRQLIGVDLPDEFVEAPKTATRDRFFDDLRAKCSQLEASVFLDPCTGIRIKEDRCTRKSHFVFLREVVALAHALPDKIVICYDQSFPRGQETKERCAKLSQLRDRGVFGAYYASHASFLIASASRKRLMDWLKDLHDIGVPKTRIQLIAAVE